MKPLDYVLLFAVLAAAVGVIIYLIRQKKKGVSLCGGDCSSCAYCARCNKEEKRAAEKKKN